jgi:hypothetical protein
VVIEFHRIEDLVDFAMMELVFEYFGFEDLDEKCKQMKRQKINIQTLLKSYMWWYCRCLKCRLLILTCNIQLNEILEFDRKENSTLK